MDPLTDPNLTCYGCAHSASGEPFPGKPAFEAACMTCARNPEVRLNGVLPEVANHPARRRFESKIPSDHYAATDLLRDIRVAGADGDRLLEVCGELSDRLPADLAQQIKGWMVARRIGKW